MGNPIYLFLCWMISASVAAHSAESVPLAGVIDVHVHAAPDASDNRALDMIESARLAQRHGQRAVVFKSHTNETANLAYLVKQVVPGIEIYGGIVLNRYTGGLNPVAVEKMAMTSGRLGRVVWMPTQDSEWGNRVRPNPDFVPLMEGDTLLPEAIKVLQQIKKHDLSLATGHSAPEASLALIRAAKAMGINRIIVTHPTGLMTIEQQKEAVALGAFVEYPVLHGFVDPGVGFKNVARFIRDVGVQNVIISTDLGQHGRPVPADGLYAAIPLLKAEGFTQDDLDLMMKRNPARFMGLPAE